MPRPQGAARSGLASELTCRALPFEMPGIDVALLWHRRHEHDAAQRWLRDTLRQAATAMAQATAPASALP